MNLGPSVGVVGATGLVGQAFLKLLNQRKFSVKKLKLFASDRSVGPNIESLKENCFLGLDIVFFATSDELSREWAPQAVSSGAIAIDNSAAFRQSPDHKLIVPEINGDLLKVRNPEIIANPNCSTIQLVMCLAPLDRAFGVSEVRTSTYQSVSGAGRAAQEELKSSTKAFLEVEDFETKEFLHPIAFNTIPQIGTIDENGFSSEESKIIFETKKILARPDLKVSAFTVRVPTFNGHAEAVWVTLKKDVSQEKIVKTLTSFAGVKVHQDYPMVRTNTGDEFVHVGRIHKDRDFANTWLMWIVCDNLLKGAALNGIQIAEKVSPYFS
ncbi:MAG: aspartate-semialdehyde dehydrogenase [Pseudomonadota bacterium]|nr:aspartate-semialdehyde dehydrogenase [Pseudomonadota bacterium]